MIERKIHMAREINKKIGSICGKVGIFDSMQPNLSDNLDEVTCKICLQSMRRRHYDYR